MSGWVWGLLCWGALATVVAAWLGAVAAKQGARERAWRKHQYETHPQGAAGRPDSPSTDSPRDRESVIRQPP